MMRVIWSGGFPVVDEAPCVVAALRVRMIGPLARQSADVREVGRTMKSVARQMVGTLSSPQQVDSLEVRIVAEPAMAGMAAVSLLFIAKTERSAAAHVGLRGALVAAAMCLPPEFKVEPVSGSDLAEALRHAPNAAVVEIQRKEHVTIPYWDHVPSEYFYHLDELRGDGSGWNQLWSTLARVPDRVVISVLFEPTELTPEERHIVGGIVSELERVGRDRVEPNLLGYETYYPGDQNAAVAGESWRNRLHTLSGTPLLCRVLVSSNESLVGLVAAQLSSAILGSEQASVEALSAVELGYPLDAEQLLVHRSLRELAIYPVDAITLWESERPPRSLRRFQYLYGLDEAAALCVLPVPDTQGVPGFEVARADQSRRSTQGRFERDATGVPFGYFVHEGGAGPFAEIPLEAINRHILVVGVTGYGKTTAVMTVLAELWRQHHIPWIVLEPTRPEYRALLAVPGVEDLQVFSVGREDVSPLRINLLEPAPKVRCAMHRSALMSIFQMAMNLETPLPDLLAASLDRCYILAGWDEGTCIEDGVDPPTIRDLIASFEECFAEAGYTGEARNICSAFGVRIRGLLSGPEARVFDTVRSSDFGLIMKRPAVFELRDIEEEDAKSLAAAVILHQVRSRQTAAGSSGGVLRHVTVVEEAHRILPGNLKESDDRGGRRERAAEQFINAIAELRSVGEGFILSSQQPTRLARAAVANCDTRLVFHLMSDTDRSAMLSDMGALDRDHAVASQLRVGECIARWFRLDDPELIQVRPSDGVDTANIPDDEVVADHMRASADETRRQRPFRLCSAKVCAVGCVESNRNAGRRLELKTRGSRAGLRVEGQSFPDYVSALARAYASSEATNEQVTYCAVAHALMDEGGDGLLGLRSDEVEARRRVLERSVEHAQEPT